MSASHQSPSVRLTYVRLPSAIPTHIYIGLPVATTPDSSSLSFVFPLLSFHRLSYHYSPRSTFQCLAQCFDPDRYKGLPSMVGSIPFALIGKWRGATSRCRSNQDPWNLVTMHTVNWKRNVTETPNEIDVGIQTECWDRVVALYHD